MASLTVGGTRLRVHPLFLLLLFALAWLERIAEGLTVFGIVLLHELGHVAAARGYGVKVKEIELLPFGGVARLEGIIETDPAVESGIALAGPLTNVFLLVLGFVLAAYDLASPGWLQLFMWTNGAVIAMNALPALPLDGGRVFRAYRARRVGYRRATYEAVRLGRILAAGLVIVGSAGVYFGYVTVTLPVLAVFVLLATVKEQRTTAYVYMAYLAGKHAELERFGSMPAEPLAARQDATVQEVADRFVPQKFHVIWIVDEGGRPVAVATETDVLDALFDEGPDSLMAAVRQLSLIDRK